MNPKQIFNILLVILTYNKLQYVNSLPVQPGVELLGRTFNVLDGFNPIADIFKYTYRYNATTPDGRFRVPDHISSVTNRICSKIAFTNSTTSFNKWKSFRSNIFKINGGYSIFSGAYSYEYKQTKMNMEQHDQTSSYSYAICSQYNLKITKMQLTGEITDAINNLPYTYNDTNSHILMDFFKTYGDHVMDSCVVGGILLSNTYTNNEFTRKYSLEETKHQAKFSFLIQIDYSDSRKYAVTQEFKQNSKISHIYAKGGAYPFAKDNWNNWANSIINHKNLACSQLTSYPITDLFPSDKKHAAAIAFHNYIYSKKGCTNSVAYNYDPNALVDDGTCKSFSCYYVNKDFNHLYKIIPCDLNQPLITQLCASDRGKHCPGKSNILRSTNSCCKLNNTSRITQIRRLSPTQRVKHLNCGTDEVATEYMYKFGMAYWLGCAKINIKLTPIVKRIAGNFGYNVKCPFGFVITGLCINDSRPPSWGDKCKMTKHSPESDIIITCRKLAI